MWDMPAEIGLENDVVVSPAVIPYDEFEAYKDTLPYYIKMIIYNAQPTPFKSLYGDISV